MTRRQIFLAAITFVALATQRPASAQPAPLDRSAAKDVIHSMRIAVQWFEANQNPQGWWSNPAFPAMTALPVMAIMVTPDVRLRDDKTLPASVTRALAFIASCAQPDGSIYKPIVNGTGGGMPGYNTALSIQALAYSSDPAHAELVRRGREYLVNAQYLGPGIYRGGFGYEANNARPYADLSNTLMALEALRATQPAETGDAGDLDWQAAIEFVSRCQHLGATNDLPWVRESGDERGGFVYHPDRTNATDGRTSDSQGTYLRSYGSMSYAGLLSFIYCAVDRDDPRVQAAHDWLTRHWSLDENPNLGPQGLYYYYHTLAKALDAWGEDPLKLADGNSIAWRVRFLDKMVQLQRIDPKTGFGYWQNDNNKWWENDPVLATSYVLRAMGVAVGGSDVTLKTAARN